jgi:ATP-dependent helicase/nuclease subunit A
MSEGETKQKGLKLIRAGAGSGKTYYLCEAVAEAVRDGFDPARLLATTFTKKAAAELKGRIQAKLLAGTDSSELNQYNADRLELASIGTVHSVAHQILSRYAVELGLSPRLEVTSEQAAMRLVSQQLSDIESNSQRQLITHAGRLGVHDLDKQLLALLDAKRSNRLSEDSLREHLVVSAKRVCELLSGEVVPVPVEHDLLLKLIREAIEHPAIQNCKTKESDAARQKLRDLQTGRLHKWGVYCEAARLKAGKRSGADAALDNLRNHAAEVRLHQELHQDILVFSELVARHAIEIEAGCRFEKTQRGLVDFTDLETLFLEALSGDRLKELIAKDFSLVLVDEFQDTNPLQLAIFQSLRDISPRCIWVGDTKQAIFGFRGTDPSLVNRIWHQVKDVETGSLPDNRRSSMGLVQLVGKLFCPVFGEDAQQHPINPSSSQNIERWVLTSDGKDSKNQEDDAKAVVAGIRALQREGHRLGDMVVLERSNPSVAKLADALEQGGVDYLFESPGLLSTREAVLVLAGMRLVLDRGDSLAAATIKHFLATPTADTPDWIIDRLRARKEEREEADASEAESAERKQPWDGDAELQPLERIDRKTSSPRAVCQLVIEALNLPTRIAIWGDLPQRCSNLDSLLKHVTAYEEQTRGSGQAATLGGAILYLEQLALDAQDIKYPPLGHDAVTIMTYHKSKGLQWPIVILSGLNSDRDPDLWRPSVSGGAEDVHDPLRGRKIRAWCWPFGMTDGQWPARRTGTTLNEDAIASPEGIQQADEELQESLRLLYVGCTRAQSKLVFAHRANKSQWLNQLPEIDELLPADAEPGEYELKEIDTTYVLRKPDAAELEGSVKRTSNRWFPGHSDIPESQTKLSPRFHSPSQGTINQDVIGPTEPSRDLEEHPLKLHELAGASHFTEGMADEKQAAFGDAIHAYLAALPSLTGVDDGRKDLVAARCLAAFGVSGAIAPQVVVQAGQRFFEWVNEKYPDACWRTEVKTIAKRAAGGNYRGTLDLVLEFPNRRAVLIDHKSAPIRRSACVAKTEEYLPQIDAYEEILLQQGFQVDSRWVHFPLAGAVVEVPRLP